MIHICSDQAAWLIVADELSWNTCILVPCDWDAGLLNAWWRHQMETLSALLALSARTSRPPVAGEFRTKRPVTRSFDVFFDLCPIKRLSKHSRGWWFETPSRPSWRNCNEYHVLRYLASINDDISFINIPNIIQDQIKARIIDLGPSIS